MRNTRRNRGVAARITRNSPMLKIGMVNRKIIASRPPMINPMANEKTSIRGQRIATRIIIMYAICTFMMSVVIRVTRLETENLSMFSKE